MINHLSREIVARATALTQSPFRLWQQKMFHRLQTEGRVTTTQLGQIEYQVLGEGPAVIYAHGTPGGFDQGVAFMHFLRGAHCTFISPSRPGYLRTPLTSGATPEEQADLYAALLDELGIQDAGIIGFSGGGPVALQFAIRHPERCRSLVMIGAIVQRNDILAHLQSLPPIQRTLAQITERLIISDLFIYLAYPFARIIPYGSAVANMFCSGAQFHLRQAGYDNDLTQFAALENYELEKISAPTLVVHGMLDQEVPFADASLLQRQIPHVTMLAYKKSDHTAFYTHAKIVMPTIHKFLIAPKPIPTAS